MLFGVAAIHLVDLQKWESSLFCEEGTDFILEEEENFEDIDEGVDEDDEY